jgi:hypothetical protein
VLIQQIDADHFQPFQHGVDSPTDVLRPAVDAVARAVRIDAEPELGGNRDTLAEGCQPLADDFLVGERSVGFSRVERRDAALDRGTDQRDGIGSVGSLTVGAGQAHASVADLRDLETGPPQAALLQVHFFPPIVGSPNRPPPR